MQRDCHVFPFDSALPASKHARDGKHHRRVDTYDTPALRRAAYVEREVYVCRTLRLWLQVVNVRYAETGCYCMMLCVRGEGYAWLVRSHIVDIDYMRACRRNVLC
jgi:hypothetical protein